MELIDAGEKGKESGKTHEDDTVTAHEQHFTVSLDRLATAQHEGVSHVDSDGPVTRERETTDPDDVLLSLLINVDEVDRLFDVAQDHVHVSVVCLPVAGISAHSLE